MILGFHYHIPYATNQNGSYVPGHFGLFIEEVAKHVSELKLFLFKRAHFDSTFFDYKLSLSNIKIIEVSIEKPAYVKYFCAYKIIGKLKDELLSCEKFLLRGPSPMDYAFSKYFNKKDICNLVVGDYGEGNKFIKQPFYRIFPVKFLNFLMHRSYIRSLEGSKIACNSEMLFENYNQLGSKAIIVNTGNVRKDDIVRIEKPNFQFKSIIKLLYVGRIDWAKGFKEMLEAILLLNKTKTKRFELHIVGWDETKEQTVLMEVKEYISKLGVGEFVIFNGKKRPGVELNQIYKDSDIFLLASYQEGFPRTIWEAFANGLPVLTTSVGSIPLKLKDKKEALFFKPHDVDSLVNAVSEVLINLPLRKELVKNGFDLVSNNTIEIQVKHLINFVSNE
jgi:glycosyltransferase involved in cell wall biosynthesis